MRALTALLFVLLAPSTAFAGESQWLTITHRTSQPIGHYEFCRLHWDECNTPNEPEQMRAISWQDFQGVVTTINNDVNARVQPMTDPDLYGKDEVWTYPRSAGDCEDYTLEKRAAAIAWGVPVGDALIAVVRKPDGEGHAVLVIHTNRGDFILDNLEDKIVLWYETDYYFLKMQSRAHPGQWVAIDDQHVSPIVASTN